MTLDLVAKASSLALADLLERWADAIPVWDADSSEVWHEFADRRYSAETALKARLLALPTCTLSSDPTGTYVELSLAAIDVRSNCCVGGACRAWVAEVRKLWGG